MVSSTSSSASTFAALDLEINTSIWFHCMMIEDRRKGEMQRPHTRWNPKRHMYPAGVIVV